MFSSVKTKMKAFMLIKARFVINVDMPKFIPTNY